MTSKSNVWLGGIPLMVIMETMRMMKTETPGNTTYRDDFAFRFADIGVSVKAFQPNPGQTFGNLQDTNDIQPVWVLGCLFTADEPLPSVQPLY